MRIVILLGSLFIFPILASAGWWYVSHSGVEIPPILFIGLSQLSILLVFALLWEQFSPTKIIADGKEDETMTELLASRAQFHTLYENSPIPYVTTKKSGEIEMYNLTATRLLKTTKDALIGKNFTDFLVEDEEGVVELILSKIKINAPVADKEVQIKTADGSTRWVLFSAYSNQRSDQKLISLVDVTEKRKVDVAKSEFVALATHQLRTPIAAVRWNLELLERSMKSGKTEKYPQYLEKVTRNVNRMVTLINDFLSVSKLETGTFAANSEEFDLQEYFGTIAEEFNQQITEKQITLNISCHPEHLTYAADTRLFHIITSNLLSNAVKYTPAGGTINMSYEAGEKTLTIVVADSGIGVPASEQEKLFTKFFRASNAVKKQAEGTGLGLYVVKQSAEQLGGNILFESEEDVGTTITVNLPR